MKNIKSTVGVACAAVAVFAASPALAQSAEPDLDPAAVAAATRYALPLAFEGYMRRCFDTLGADSYAVINADRLRVKFNDGAEEAWPGAKVLMIETARREASDLSAVFDMMGDEELRPFVDSLVENLAEQEVRLEDCEKIDRGLEIFDPMPADNVAAMIGFLVEVALESDDLDISEGREMTESRERKLREQEEENDQ